MPAAWLDPWVAMTQVAEESTSHQFPGVGFSSQPHRVSEPEGAAEDWTPAAHRVAKQAAATKMDRLLVMTGPGFL